MAPMVDLSHEPYRELVRGMGGCDRFYSEMLNSRMVPNENREKSLYLKFAKTHDLIMQLVGNDPERMHAAARRLDGFEPCGIDINMGCYLKKVTCHGWGVALMKDITLAGKVAGAVRSATERPVSAKLRIGFTLDKGYLLDFADMLVEAGMDFLVLHARTAQDGLSRTSRWEYIALLKDHVPIPVVGNGDVKTPQDAVKMLKRTGCDGVMVGRQALAQPWIFRDIRALLQGKDTPQTPDIQSVMLHLARLIETWFGPETALKRFKLALPWLASNLKFGHHLCKEVNRAQSLDLAREALRAAFDAGMS
ncbi:MAG: tRNA-dihydrouridine synthase family protein [Syntrophaceae bacterium]